MNIERERLLANVLGPEGWKHWGPYLSERQWGTVREDYSPGGTAWEYFPHDHARSRAYRWGEDGIGGVCDAEQLVCLSLALWNGADPILKERMFGLTNAEGNHGEDVKEHYFYLDATPTHSYLKMLYKYPHRAFPYADLVAENARRGTDVPEYELLDTGIFAENRYFDVFIEYAQAEPGDILMKVTVWNRGPSAMLHVMPQLVLRNTWSWEPGSDKPQVQSRRSRRHRNRAGGARREPLVLRRQRRGALHRKRNQCAALVELSAAEGYFKDGFHDRIVHGLTDRRESRAFRHQGRRLVSVHDRRRRQARVSPAAVAAHPAQPFKVFDATLAQRQREADAYYADLQKGMSSADERVVQRQAFAGLIWNKQFYYLDVPRWLQGDPGQPKPPDSRLHGRDIDWRNLNNADILSMPDNWEYPWYASWDLAFHCIPFALDRCGIRQAPIGIAHARMVHAPQRPNSRLRVGLQRRQSAGARLGDLARVSNRPQTKWRQGRPGVSRARVSQAHAEFHLVGQPQGRPGAEYFPGRILGPGQHRGVRPQRAAAHRRLHQSIRRHQLDGDVCAEPDAHRAGTRRNTIMCTKTSPASSSSTS